SPKSVNLNSDCLHKLLAPICNPRGFTPEGIEQVWSEYKDIVAERPIDPITNKILLPSSDYAYFVQGSLNQDSVDSIDYTTLVNHIAKRYIAKCMTLLNHEKPAFEIMYSLLSRANQYEEKSNLLKFALYYSV